MDEATGKGNLDARVFQDSNFEPASVDYETDRNIQATIQEEFKDKTLLCIAHRLQTIIGYDKICVIDSGRVAEFDTPARLFEQKDGIFRGMCDRSGITLADIKNATRD